ncbi:hypothetical protein Apa02nite_000240 [Actinoplanes palleronii]|uniref:Integral membrane protein n=2 Tax=Actinoplanes palleronii TaxID=113570 RepID=A0ABQ4B026_9ACTN|nr:hypothetical protein Apa02nite_000240 [Actinoplanes palleronii]
MLRARYPVVAVAAAALALLVVDPPFDLRDFSDAGQRLLDGRLDGIYDSGWNQAGPLQFLLSRLLMLGSSGGAPATPVTMAVNVALALGAMALVRRLTAARGAGAALRETAAGLLAVLWLALPVPWEGHPPEMLIPGLWAYAMVLHDRKRTATSAVILGLSVAIAPWAILGFPCLLAVAGLGRAIRSGLLAAGAGVAAYLPFVLSGHFGMFHHVWTVDPDTLVHLLLPDLVAVTWPLRLVQAVLVAGGCAAVAYRFRGQRVVWAAAPAAALLIRLVSDPVSLRYYWGPVAVATVGVFALAERGRRQGLALGLGYLAAMSGLLGGQVAGSVGCLAGLLVVLFAGSRGVPSAALPLSASPAAAVPVAAPPDASIGVASAGTVVTPSA